MVSLPLALNPSFSWITAGVMIKAPWGRKQLRREKSDQSFFLYLTYNRSFVCAINISSCKA